MMDLNLVMMVMLGVMLVLILTGIHIGFAMGLTALIGTAVIFDNADIAIGMVGGAAYDVLRSFVFATIPLFILMGDFVAKSGAARDLYQIINRGLSRVPGRLTVATVLGNAVFAAVTGVSIAAAAAFSRIAYPQMRRYGYKRTFALGSIAGSSCLGMLIPPSILLIIWGIITEISIGKLFLAGVIPGLLLTILFCAYNIIAAMRNPAIAPSELADQTDGENDTIGPAQMFSGFGILALISLVMGGIWGGLFTATEAAGVGALGAMALGIAKGMRTREILQAVIDASRTTAPIMFLLLTAAMYSRFLALSGIIGLISSAINDSGLGPTGTLILMVTIWLLLGMLLDSASIILLTVPVFWPVAQALGYDPLAFAIIGIIVIEAGLLTPPFGLLVYAVKGTVDDPDAKLGEIFKGSVPYWLLMLLAVFVIWLAPGLASWLPSL